MKFRVLAAAGVLLAGSVVSAQTASLPSTLDQLITSGTTVTVGDKTFSDFSVSGSVAASQIHVVQAPGTDVGVEFQFNWSSTGGNNQDTLIRYKVHVIPTNTSITGVGLHFDGTTDANNTSPGNSANVTETVSDINGNLLGNITVFNAGPNLPALNRNDSLFAVSATRDLTLAKDIQVHTITDGNDTATISLVDNTFQQTTTTNSVPLPPAAVMGFTSMALGALALIRRRVLRAI